jgi:hypothetical protein
MYQVNVGVPLLPLEHAASSPAERTNAAAVADHL